MTAKSPVNRLFIVLAFASFVLMFVFVGKSGFVSEAGAVAPGVAATKSVGFAPGGDVDGDGKADPGDILQYSVTVNNTGADAATGLYLEDALQNITTLSGVANIVPVARNDSFNAVGNVLMVIPDGAGDLLSNDSDYNGGTLTITGWGNTAATAGANPAGNTAAASASGGRLTVRADGSFDYNPPRGLTPTETFFYTISDGQGSTAVGQATVNVAGRIWFVNNNAGACPAVPCDGRLTNPYPSLTELQGNNNGVSPNPQAGDSIIVYSSATNYVGSVTLLNNQKLIGQGATPSPFAQTGIATAPSGTNQLPASAARPTLVTTAAATNTVNIALGASALIRGLILGNTTGVKINGAGANFGTLTFNELTLNGTGRLLNLSNGAMSGTFDTLTTTSAPGGAAVSLVNITSPASVTNSGTTSITGAGGAGINISGTSANISFGNTTITTPATQGILIGTTTGNITFGATSVSGGTDAISLQNNSAGTRTFASVSTSNNSGVGFLHAVGGGATTVTGATTITNPGGGCLSIANSTTQITFNNVSATQCGGTGVFINNPNANGDVTFADLDITPDAGQRAFQAQNTTGTITTTSGTIGETGAGGAPSVFQITGDITPLNMTLDAVTSLNGASTAGVDAGIYIDQASGTLTVGATTVTNPAEIGIRVLRFGAGTISFGPTSVTGSASDAIRLGETGGFNNTGNFTFGALTVTPDSGARGLWARENAGTITIPSGTITTINQPAVEISRTSSTTPLNITLTSVTVSGSATGISLSNTSSSGGSNGFRILGSGSTAGSGGTISNISGADESITSGIGVYLDNAANITLTNMNFTGAFGNFGIRGQNVTNFTLRDSNLSGTFGTSELIDEATIRFGTENFTTGIKGTALFEGNTIGGGYENNLSVFVYGSDTLNMTVQDSASDPAIFNDQSSTLGDDALHVESGGTGSNLTLLVNGVRFNGARGDQLQTGQIGVTTQTLTITNNEFLNTAPGIVSGGGGVWLLGGSLANTSNVNVDYVFSGNTIKGAQGDAFRAIYTGYAATISGLVLNNTIGTSNGVFETNTNGGSVNGGVGIDVGHAKGEANSNNNLGTINHAVRIEGNTIRDIKNGNAGIIVTNGSKIGGMSRLEATVKNNTVAEVGPDLLSGFYAIGGGMGAADVSKTGLVITGNSFTAGSGTGGSAIFLDFFATSSANYYIPGYTITANSTRGENVAPAGGTASASLEAFWVPQNGTLTNGPFPGPTGNPATGKKVDAGGTKNITNDAFVLAVPTRMPPAEEEKNQTAAASDKYLDFRNALHQTPAEMLTSIEPFGTLSNTAETISGELIAEIGGEFVPVRYSAKAGAELRKEQTKYAETFAAFLSEVSGKLSSAVSPTVFAQESKTQFSGETVSTASMPFTLPAGESVTIVFKAAVDDGPYPAGVNNITNQAQIKGTNFADVTSNTTSIPLDAAPSLEITATDAGATTQPGGTIVYTLNYRNITSTRTQNATGVDVSLTVPANATFKAASSTAGWSCNDGAPAGTNCIRTIGSINAGDSGSVTFAVNTLGGLPADVQQLSMTASIADDGANGADLNTADNMATETTNIIGNWLGTLSTDWFTSNNWSNATIPPAGNNISIPTEANQPAVLAAGGDVSVGDLVLNGSNLDIGAGRTVLVAGAVDLKANRVTGPGTISLAATSAITRSSGQVESTLKKTFGAAGPLFTFPVGTVGAYSPVDVTVTAGAGDLSVKANTGTAPASPVALDATKTLQRFWTLNGSGITSDVTFNYLSGDVPGTANESAFHIVRAPIPTGTPTRFAPNGSQFILNAAGNSFTVKGLNVYSNWTLAEPLAPTAATVFVGGRVLDAQGRAVSGAQIALVDANGSVRLSRTNPFGYYRFFDVPAGSDYTVNVAHKLHEFAPRFIFVTEDSAEVDFVGMP